MIRNNEMNQRVQIEREEDTAGVSRCGRGFNRFFCGWIWKVVQAIWGLIFNLVHKIFDSYSDHSLCHTLIKLHSILYAYVNCTIVFIHNMLIFSLLKNYFNLRSIVGKAADCISFKNSFHYNKKVNGLTLCFSQEPPKIVTIS